MGCGGGISRLEALGKRLTCGECGDKRADEDIACAMGADERDGKRGKHHRVLALPHSSNAVSAGRDDDARIALGKRRRCCCC